MTISDYIIIYLAAGSPFAVSVFLQMTKDPLAHRLVRTVITLIAWPASAAAWIYRKVRGFNTKSRAEQQEEVLDRKIREIRSSIEENLRQNRLTFSVYEWRETFERYAGLARALAQPENELAEMELFAISGQKNKLATVCLNRRNRNRLIFHHTQARNDFVDALMDGVGRDDTVLRQAIKLTELLGDVDAMLDLTAMLGCNEQNYGKIPVIDMEQKVWNPPTPKSHTINRI